MAQQPQKRSAGGGKKQVTAIIKVEIPAQEAAPSQKLGPALGSAGLNIMEFCKAFNEATASLEKGVPTPVEITARADRSFSFIIKTPPASWYLRKAAGLNKGSSMPGRETIGRIKASQIREIAEAKMKDLNAQDIESAMRIIEGSAQSMGLRVV